MSICSFSFQPLVYRYILLSGVLVLFTFFWFFPSVLTARGAQKHHGCAPGSPPALTPTPALTITPAPASPTRGFLLINELLSNPHSTWNCSETSGSYTPSLDSWIELYNPQSRAVDLYAAHARLSLDGGRNWYYLPLETQIAPKGFLVAFPEENLSNARATWSEVQFAFASTLIDQVKAPQLAPDQSYARVPDGSDHWQQVSQPTIDASNNTSKRASIPTPMQRLSPTIAPFYPTEDAPVSAGTEPLWKKVQGPPEPASRTNIPTVVLTSAPKQQPLLPAPQANHLDGLHIALITALSLLLFATLGWCWRLFRVPLL